MQTLKFSDRILVSREGRIFDKFEKSLKEWDNQAKVLSEKIHRSPDESVITRAYEGRARKELAHTMELVKTDEERLGRKYWYVTLRNYEDGSNKEKIESNKMFRKVKNNM